MTRLAAAAAALALLPMAALAQESGIAFTFGAGVASVPDYFGADENTVSPDITFDLGYVALGPLRFGNPDPDAVRTGLGFRGSFRYVPAREGDRFAGDDRAFAPLDAAVEIGGGLRYAQPWYEAFAVARYGVTGHESLVGEAGLDLIARPTDRLALRAGPRVLLGSDDYATYYFGGTDDTSSAAPAFEAEGGLLSSGLEVGATYRLTDRYAIEAALRYDRLRNAAADSPVSLEDDQLSASLAVTRRFDLRF